MSELLKTVKTPQELMLERRHQWLSFGKGVVACVAIVLGCEGLKQVSALVPSANVVFFGAQVVAVFGLLAWLIKMLIQVPLSRAQIAEHRRVFEKNERKLVQQIYAEHYEDLERKIDEEERAMSKLVQPLIISSLTCAIGIVATCVLFVMAWLSIFSSWHSFAVFGAAVVAIGGASVALLNLNKYLQRRAQAQTYRALHRDYTQARRALHEGEGGVAAGSLSVSDSVKEPGGELTAL